MTRQAERRIGPRRARRSPLDVCDGVGGTISLPHMPGARTKTTPPQSWPIWHKSPRGPGDMYFSLPPIAPTRPRPKTKFPNRPSTTTRHVPEDVPGNGNNRNHRRTGDPIGPEWHGPPK
eukprot:scaffold11999_cov56-Attheya_sp.AAC.1